MSPKRRILALTLAAALLAATALLIVRGTGPGQPEMREANTGPARRAADRDGEGAAAGPHSAEGGGGSPASREFSDHLAPILTGEGRLNVRQRVNWVRSHGDSFQPNDVESVFAYLQTGGIPEGLSPGNWHWLVDELFSALRNGTKEPEQLTRQLAEVFSNSGLDPVVRDYALQHLGHLGRQGGDAALVRAAAMAGLREVSTPMAGTALLLLHREPRPGPASGQQSPVDPGALALDLLANERAAVPARVTALQVASQREAAGLREQAGAILSRDTSIFLQFAALAAVRKLGTPADLETLQGFKPNNPQLARARRDAIQLLAPKQ